MTILIIILFWARGIKSLMLINLVLYQKIFEKAKCRTIFIVSSYLYKTRELYHSYMHRKLQAHKRHSKSVMMRKMRQARVGKKSFTMYSLVLLEQFFLQCSWNTFSNKTRSLILTGWPLYNMQYVPDSHTQRIKIHIND